MLPKDLSGLSFSTDPENVLKFLKSSSKHSKSSEVHQRYSRRPQSPKRVINVHKILWSSNFLKRSSNGPNKVFKRFLWKELKRSTRSPQKVKKMHKCYPRTSQASVSQLILKMSSNSSKGPQSPRSPQWSTKGIQDDLNVVKTISTSSKSLGRQKFLKRSSNGLHKALKSSQIKSSKGPREVIKSSWKVLQCFEILRSSGLQKVHKRSTKSSKSQENAQMLPKVLSGLSFSTDPQNVFKFLKRSSKPSKSPVVHKRYTRRPQCPQNVINVLDILWSSNFLKRSSNGPNEVFKRFLWKEPKRSSRSHQKVLEGSSMFWGHQVLSS